jgi:hypothetical protein
MEIKKRSRSSLIVHWPNSAFHQTTPCLRIFMDDYDLISDLIGYYKEVVFNFKQGKGKAFL